MNYKIEGKGETLVFIHGLSDSLEYWEFLASNLKTNYQVLRMDLRGHGKSDLNDDEITIDLYTNDLKELLDDLNLKKVNLIGFSLGGLVALNFALKYPDRVSSMVLMSTFVKTDDYLTNVFTRLKHALKNGFKDFYDLILPMVLCPAVIEENKVELDIIRESASEVADTEAYIKAIDACLDFDVEDKLSQINIPVLVLASKYDEISLLDSQVDFQFRIRNSRLIVFDDVKHNLLVGKNNGEVLKILKNFFS